MQERYCVTCGAALTPDLAHGLVCVECFKSQNASGRRAGSVVLVLSYCWRCGEQMEPTGNEIEHFSREMCVS